jgi:membrane-bound serine protease (ClpP class)
VAAASLTADDNALMLHWFRRTCTLLVVLGIASFPLAPSSGQVSNRVVDVLQLKGFLDPPSAGYLKERIAAAQTSPADEAVIVELDTDGGLISSIPELLQQMSASRVPVVVWVAPRGAVAQGAGALLVAAGDLSYMADAARLGSPAPANLNSAPDDKEAISRTEALIRRVSQRQGHSSSLPLTLLSSAGSISSIRAARGGAIDGVASSLSDVLRHMDGRSVTLGDGGHTTLETWNQNSDQPSVGFRFEEMDLWARLLHSVMTPVVAFLLLLVGAFGLIFEVYNPGIGLGAIIGVSALSLSLYALDHLPTNWPGVLIVVVAIAFFVVDVQLSGFGAWSAGGVALLVAGAVLMFAGAPAAAHLAIWAIVAGVLVSLLFFVSVMTAALRVRLRRPITGEEGIVGTIGQARTDIAPEGTVFTKGALWRARTMETGIAAGSMVEIKATEGLVLLVEPLSDAEAHRVASSSPTSGPVSAVQEDEDP